MIDHGGMIWRLAGSYEADPELRTDLYQDILLAIWRALPRFRGDSSVRTYVARIAHYRGVSHVSREASRPVAQLFEDDLPSNTPSPEDASADLYRRLALEQAIRRLPLDQRQPVSLTLEGFKPGEIAHVLGISANAVSIRLTRAKQALNLDMEKTHA